MKISDRIDIYSAGLVPIAGVIEGFTAEGLKPIRGIIINGEKAPDETLVEITFAHDKPTQATVDGREVHNTRIYHNSDLIAWIP